jgi:hypothetical protein
MSKIVHRSHFTGWIEKTTFIDDKGTRPTPQQTRDHFLKELGKEPNSMLQLVDLAKAIAIGDLTEAQGESILNEVLTGKKGVVKKKVA